jgi:DNA primase
VSVVPANLIDDARSSDILAVARQYGVTLKRVTPSELAGACPRCGGSDRFSVNVRKQLFNCRGCDVGGDAIALVRHLEARVRQMIC